MNSFLERFDFILEGGKKPFSYEEIWNFQKEQLERIIRGEAKESVLFCEHETVITAGRRAQADNILNSNGVALHHIERGGDVTLHSPGQLVIYPLFRLQGEFFSGGLNEFLRFWEQVLIDLFSENFHLDAGRFGPTGVWIRRKNSEVKKIVSIGIAVRRWVTYHGISINVCNDLEEFNRIRPCDFESGVMTSLEREGVNLTVSEISDLVYSTMKRNLERSSENRSSNLSRSTAL